MKTTIKFGIILAAVAAFLALPFEAQAQLGSPVVVVTSGTTSGAYAAITNNTTAYPTNAIIDCGSKAKCGVQIVAALSDSGTTANTVVVQQSIDKQNWVAHTTFTMTPAGTTTASAITNLDVSGIPYLRVYSIANANANTGYITNYTIRAFPK